MYISFRSRLVTMVLGLALLWTGSQPTFAAITMPVFDFNKPVNIPNFSDLRDQIDLDIETKFDNIVIPDLFPDPTPEPDPLPDPTPEPDPLPDPTPVVVGSLDFSAVSVPATQLLPTDTEGEPQLLLTVMFDSEGEDVVVDSLTVRADAALLSALESVELSYPSAQGVLQSLGSLTNTGVVNFVNLGMIVPQNDLTELKVFGHLNSVEQGAVPGSRGRVYLDASGQFKASGQLSGYVDTNARDSIGLVQQQSNIVSTEFILRMAVAQVTVNDLPNSVLADGAMVVSNFSVTANGGAVAISKLSWDFIFTEADVVTLPGLRMANIYLRNADNPAVVLPVKTMMFRKFNTEGTLVIEFAEEQIIPAGLSENYHLIADISNSEAGDSISTMLVGDSNEQQGTAETVGLTSNFVWSDMSGYPHRGFDSTDWLNGVYIPGLPADTQVLAR